jgi:hypothetical protein
MIYREKISKVRFNNLLSQLRKNEEMIYRPAVIREVIFVETKLLEKRNNCRYF